MVTVVAALIEKDGKYLIARRSTGSEDVMGKWEFPGGKVEKEELPVEVSGINIQNIHILQ